MGVRGVVAAAALLCAARPAAADASWDAVNELLRNATLRLGTVSYDDNSTVKLELGNIEINDVNVMGLTASSDDTAPGHVDVSLHLEALNFDLKSDPFALYFLGAGGNGSATLHGSMGLTLGMRMQRSGPGAPPTNLSVTACEAPVYDLQLSCSGGGVLLGIACAGFSGVAPGIVSNLLCGTDGMLPPLLNGLSPLLANLSAKLDAAAAAPVPAPPPVPETELPFAGDHAFDFNSSGAVRVIDIVLNKVYGAEGPNHRLVIDDLIRHSFGNEPLVVPLGMAIPIGADLFGLNITEIAVVNASLGGVSLTEMELLDVVGRLTTRNRLNMSAALDMFITVTMVTGGVVQPAGAKVVEGLRVKVGLKEVSLFLQLLVAADSGAFGEITLGQLTSSWGSMLGCLVGAVFPGGVNMTSLQLHGGSLTEMSLALSVVEPKLTAPGGGLNALIDSGATALRQLYGKSVGAALPYLTAAVAAPLLNELLRGLVASPPACVQPTVAAHSTIDFGDNTLIGLMDFFLNNVTGAIGQPFDINAVVSTLTTELGGDDGGIDLPGSWTFDNHGEKIADIDLGRIRATVSDVSVHNINTFHEFRVLEPHAHYLLDSDIDIGGPAVTAAATVSLLWEGVGPTVNDTMRIGVSLDDVKMLLDMFARLDRLGTSEVKVRQLSDTGCLMHAFTHDGLRLPTLLATFQRVAMSINCTDPATGAMVCSSPQMPQLIRNLASPDAPRILTSLADQLMRLVNRTMAADTADQEYARWINVAQCPTPPTPPKKDKDTTAGDIVLYVFVGGVTFVFSVFAFTLSLVRARRLLRVTESETRPISAITKGAGVRERTAFETLKCEQAMFWHPGVSVFAKWGVPVALLGGFACLVSGHLDPAATYVDIELEFAGDHLVIDHMFDFSLHTAVVDMWNAGVYPLSALVAIFSGAWAYIKLIGLFWIWFMPPTLLHPTKERGRLLEFMDFFGKYSLIDLYVMVMMAVSFRLHMDPPTDGDWSLLPPGFVIVDLYVKPGWGLYGYTLAIFVALIVGHVEIVHHRNVLTAVAAEEREERLLHGRRGSSAAFNVEKEQSVATGHSARTGVSTQSSWFREGAEDGRKQALVAHVFKRNPFPSFMTRDVPGYTAATGSTTFSTLTTPAKVTVTAVLVVTLGSMIAGAVIHSFSFTFKGLAAFAVQISPGESIHRPYSVLSLPAELMHQTEGTFKSYLEYGFPVFCMYATTFVVPVLQFLGLICIWCVPLTLRQHKMMFFLNECFAASAAVEVLIISLLAALLQISQFAQFVVGSKCDSINPPLEEMSRLGFFASDQAKCFDVTAALEEGCWVLFAAAAVSYVVYFLLNKANKVAIRERERAFLHATRASRADGGGDADTDTDDDDGHARISSALPDEPAPRP